MHACTEVRICNVFLGLYLTGHQVRAANLSGECSIRPEFLRGNMKLFGAGKECVERRALLSVKANPSCQVSYKIRAIVALLLMQLYPIHLGSWCC